MYKELKDGEQKSHLAMKESTGAVQILSEWEMARCNDPTACTVDHVLQLLQRLFALSMEQTASNNRFGKRHPLLFYLDLLSYFVFVHYKY